MVYDDNNESVRCPNVIRCETKGKEFDVPQVEVFPVGTRAEAEPEPTPEPEKPVTKKK